MRIAIFGLGYVGSVSAACLADLGHTVIGVDVNPEKIAAIRRGQSPIIEPGLDELLAATVARKRLSVTLDALEAVRHSQLSLVCVGTPSLGNGSLDLRYLDRVMEEIGAGLGEMADYHVVAIRSTLLPGITRSRLVPVLEAASSKKAGPDFGVCVNPEFLREGTAIGDFYNPPFNLVGQWDARSGDVVAQAYARLSGPTFRVDPDAAAMVKYASNAYHALKVVFANEIGAICKEFGVDSHPVMEVFCQDRTLNISRAYLKPGFAFGGSCLPKDLRSLLYAAQHADVEVPVLRAVLASNDLQIQRALRAVTENGKRRVGLLGLSFKPGTDDLRESPLVLLAEMLIGKGYQLAIYDEEVSLSRVFGRNREYIERVLPHINSLLTTDLLKVVQDSQVLIVGKDQVDPDRVRDRIRPDHLVVDLVRSGDWRPARQLGIAW